MAEKIKKIINWFAILIIGIVVFLLGNVFSTSFLKEAGLEKAMADTETNTTTAIVEFSNYAPSLGTAILNAGNDIELTENVTTTVSATATVTDTNGYNDIASVIGKIYRSGVGSDCSEDDNNCYADSACATSSCSSNSCVATCEYEVWFHADATDASSSYSSQTWDVWMKVIDASNASSSATSSGVDIKTLLSLDLSTTTINYGSLKSGSTTGNTNQTTTVIVTGNSSISVSLYGTNLEKGVNNIDVGYQEYGGNPFTYGAGINLSGSSTACGWGIGKPTNHPSNSTSSIYWGAEVPANTPKGVYNGTTTFEATTPPPE